MIRCASAVLLTLLAGCAGLEVKTDHDREVDFAAYETFVLAPPPDESAELPNYRASLGRKMLERIATALEASGLRQVEGDDYDLFVNMNIGSKSRTGIQGYGSDRRFPAGRQTAYEAHYVIGRLVVDLFDRRQKKVVWHGYASTDIDDYTDVEHTALDAVSRIMARYPPGN